MRKFGFLAFAAALFAALGASAIERHDDSYVRDGVTYAQRGGMSAETYVVTNVDMTSDDVGAVGRDETWESVSNKAMTAIQTLEPATNYTDEVSRQNKTDFKVYRKVKDIWTWENWSNPEEPLAKDAPADFLALANSPGSEPIRFERGAWWGAVQFWPNGKVKYSQSEIPPGGTGELSTTVNFAMYAYDETGTNEIYRFGATATREDPTNETVVAWDETRNQYVRIATTDMVDESVRRGMTAKDGAARALPPYLHYMPFDDVYTNDAAWYYEQAATNYVHGSCSARRVGGILERNYDWEFDRAPEFVIPVSGSDTRFASVGIANVGRLLTEDFVTSGKWSRHYRCLPGHTLDGVNENGVVAEINVVGGVPFGWGSTGDIHPLGAVRWALDNGTSAEMVATSLAVRVKFPAGWSQNFHYMIADAAQTWIVENGAAHLVGDASVSAVMTNFRLYPTHDTEGEGQERYAILSNPANAITDAWFTRCYKRETTPPWTSDLTGLLAYTNAIYDAWATHDREFFRDMAIDGKRWWQTVHTAIYDFEAKTLKVCVQEGDDWYVFAVGGSGRVKSVNGKVGHVTLEAEDVNALPDDEDKLVENENFSAAVERVSPPVEIPEKWAFANVTNANGNAVIASDVGAYTKEQSDALTNGLRRVDDMAVYTNSFTSWSISPNDYPAGYHVGWFDNGVDVGWTLYDENDYSLIAPRGNSTSERIDWGYMGDHFATRTRSFVPGSDTLATSNGVNAATNRLAKTRLPSWLTAESEEPRSRADLNVYKREYGSFGDIITTGLYVYDGVDELDGSLYWRNGSNYIKYNPVIDGWLWWKNDGLEWANEHGEDALTLTFATFPTMRRPYVYVENPDGKLAHTSATSGLAKLGDGGELTAATPGTDYATPSQIAGKIDKEGINPYGIWMYRFGWDDDVGKFTFDIKLNESGFDWQTVFGFGAPGGLMWFPSARIVYFGYDSSYTLQDWLDSKVSVGELASYATKEELEAKRDKTDFDITEKRYTYTGVTSPSVIPVDVHWNINIVLAEGEDGLMALSDNYESEEDVPDEFDIIQIAPAYRGRVTSVHVVKTITTQVVDRIAKMSDLNSNSLRIMLVDANVNTNMDRECISTNLCKLIKPHIEAVNVVAEHYDEKLEALWSVYITDGDMKFSVKTNEDTTAFREANSVLTDVTTEKKYRIGIDDGEMKFFTNEFGNPQ